MTSKFLFVSADFRREQGGYETKPFGLINVDAIATVEFYGDKKYLITLRGETLKNRTYSVDRDTFHRTVDPPFSDL